ncbi:MAG: hypothetical protein CR997_12175 [Acidobacteria bacterium]|nr:MAG: hypothetical protein CR997_12175 [Acidobacteriota bacterium]
MTEPKSIKTNYFDAENLFRIWELELVISGAVIVALFQLPKLLDDFYANVEMHVSSDIYMAPFMLYYIGKLILYPLILTFILHFLLRGFWVGLLGLSYVFPNGVNWSKLDLPPLQERLYKRETLDLKSLMDRVDVLSSTLFSILFLLLIVFMWIGLLFVLSVFLSFMLKSSILPSYSQNLLMTGSFYVLLFLFTLPQSLAALIDKRFKKNKHPLGKATKLGKLVFSIYKVSYWLSLGFLCMPILLVFRSNLEKGKAMFGFFALVMLFPIIFATSFFLSKGIVSFDSYQYFPKKNNEGYLMTRHYDNLRPPGQSFRVPTIQADIIQDPYLKLFIPFSAKRDNTLMQEQCPELEPYRADGFHWLFSNTDENRNQSVIDCIVRLFELELNGETLKDVEYMFYTHPQTGVKGILAHIDMDRARKGKNLLVITKLKTKNRLEKEEKSAKYRKKNQYKGIYRIPFWK